MEYPSQLIRRAEANRRRKAVPGRIAEAVQADAEPLARPMPTNHAGYTRLMRSHDRIRTRHLSKNPS